MSATAALLALAFSLATQDTTDAGDAPPEGSAVHTLQLEAERRDALRARLDTTHAALLASLGGTADDPSPLARPLAAQHAHWLAYRQADCALAGVLTDAGGSWPAAHGLGCQVEHLSRRLAVLERADACLRALPATASPYQQHDCLRGLVDWSIGEP